MEIFNNKLQWFVGVVEDRMDPLKQGRVRVRVVGLHSAKRVQGPVEGIPTNELPWMSVIQPITSASMSGIGGSVTGPVEGTRVYGHFLDKWRTNGIVLGTYGGNVNVKPNKLDGFSDPTGQYPRYLGNDTNVLNQGGESGYDSTSNIIQDNNIDTAINPDDRPLSEIPEDNNPKYTIEEMVHGDEGLRLKVYRDLNGRGWTVGIGHYISDNPNLSNAQINAELSKQVGRTVTGNPGSITMEEASKLFDDDLKKVQRDLNKSPTVSPVYLKVNRSRQMALENMAFQMGIGGLAKFTTMLKAMYDGDWEKAYRAGRDSLWYQQTKGRASRVTLVIRTGNLESYGVEVPKSGRMMRSLAEPRATESNDPADPPIPNDSRILFKEPESSYKGEYPYVHTMESESGHIQEFDDTPGQERYRLIHPTGSYEEVAPTGRRTIKTVDNLYDITNADGNFMVSGDKKTNIGGSEIYYNMDNRLHQIDGNDTIFIRGDQTKTVEGNGTILVKGNVKVVIQGTADITVEQEAFITVEKDTTVNVNQNADISVKQKATVNAQNMDVNVEQDLNFTATNINLNASNTVLMDGGVLSKVTGGNVQVG